MLTTIELFYREDLCGYDDIIKVYHVMCVAPPATKFHYQTWLWLFSALAIMVFSGMYYIRLGQN